MKRISFIFVLALALAGLCIPSSGAPIRVTKTAEESNPKLQFIAGGNQAMDNALRSMLRACGWFDLVAANGDYQLTSAQSGNQVVLTLRTGNSSRTFRMGMQDSRETAKILVDAILAQEFKIKGICRSRIVFCSENSPNVRNLYLCDIDGGNIQRLTDFRSLCVEPVWRPGNRSVIYSKYNASSIDVVETQINPRRTRVLVAARGLNAGAAVSPNGRDLALIMSKDRTVDLYVKPLAGGSLRALTSNTSVEASPTWAPNGQKICFVSNISGGARLYEVSASGGTPRCIPTLGGDATRPAYASNGSLAYNTRENGFFQLAVIRAGENPPGQLVTNAGSNYESPAWAPDNRHLICSRSFGGKASLWVIDSFTGNQRLLLSGQGSLTMPSWSTLMQ